MDMKMNKDKNEAKLVATNVELLKNFKGFYIPETGNNNNTEPVSYKEYTSIAIKYLKYGVYIPYKYLNTYPYVSKDMLECLYDIAKDLYGVDFLSYNNGLFHKSLKKLLNCPMDTLVYEQLLNYIGRYNSNIGEDSSSSNIVIAVPYETYDIQALKENEKNIKINILKRLSKEEVFNKVSSLLSKNIGLSDDVKEDMFNILKDNDLLDKFYKEYLLKGLVNNRETRYILYSYMSVDDFNRYIIESGNVSYEEIIRYILYRVTGKSTIIKHDRGYRGDVTYQYSVSRIDGNNYDNDILNILHDTLKSIINSNMDNNIISLFRQYKDIFMLFKSLINRHMEAPITDAKNIALCKETINYINRISRVSRNRRDNHKGIVNKFFVSNNNGKLSLSNNVTFRDYMEILNVLYDIDNDDNINIDKFHIINNMIDSISKAEDYKIYQLIALYNSFNYYFVCSFADSKNAEKFFFYYLNSRCGEDKDKNPDKHMIHIPYVYRIRNGKMYIKDKSINAHKVHYIAQIISVLLNTLKYKISDIVSRNIDSLYNNNNKNNNTVFVLDKDIRLAMPTTNKSFVGHIPMGSYIDMHSNKGVIAIHWKNVIDKETSLESHWDIDLHLSDLSGDIDYGWNSYWSSRSIGFNSIKGSKYFKGDSPYILLLNKYFNDEYDSNNYNEYNNSVINEYDDFVLFTGDCTSAPLPYGATEAFIVGARNNSKNNDINAYKVDIHDYSGYIGYTDDENSNDYKFDLIVCNADNIDLNSLLVGYNGNTYTSLDYKDKPMIYPNKNKDYTVVHSLNFKDGQDLNVGYLLKDNTNNLSFVFTNMVFDTIPTNTLKSDRGLLNQYIIRYLTNTVKSKLYLDTLLTDMLHMKVVYKGSKEYKDIVNIEDKDKDKDKYNIIDLTVDNISKDTLLNMLG